MLPLIFDANDIILIRKIESSILKLEEAMNFPVNAARSFQKLKGDFFFRKIYKTFQSKYKKMKDSIKRTRFFHQQIDEQIDDLLEDEVVSKHISCKKGCSACCHSQVSITRDEASLLADKIINENVEVNWSKLFIQAKAENSSADFFKIAYGTRGCVFLGREGDCRIYADRPAVCRTNYVVSDPKSCSTEDGQEKSVSLLKTFEADMIIYGAFELSKENGALPYMLLKELEKKVDLKEFKNSASISE